MKTRLIPSALLAAALIGLIATTGWSEEKPETAKKAHPLGAEHTLLGHLVGEWEVAGEWFMPGADQGMPYTGTATGSWVVGDKYVRLSFESQLPMGKLEVVSFSGYDRDKKRWQAVTMRSMGPNMGGEMVTTEPVWDKDARSWTSEYEAKGMMGEIKVREVVTLNADGSVTMMSYSTPKGQEGAKEAPMNKLTYKSKS
jgi:hypothetical protein